MKRIVVLLAALLLASSSVASVAYADVVWGNAFENKHRDETQKLTRFDFVVNSPDGYVIAQLEPGQSEEIARSMSLEDRLSLDRYGFREGDMLPRYENGDIVLMDRVILHENEYWGVTQASHSSGIVGWIRMDHVLVSYTPQDFIEANRDNFYEFTGVFKLSRNPKGVVLWEWPGSDRPKRVLEETRQEIEIDYAYRDAKGREWGYASRIYDVDYWWLPMSGWICLSDPKNSDLPAFNPEPTPKTWAPDAVYDWTIVGGEPPTPSNNIYSKPLLFAFLAVILAVACTTGASVYRRTKRKQG